MSVNGIKTCAGKLGPVRPCRSARDWRTSDAVVSGASSPTARRCRMRSSPTRRTRRSSARPPLGDYKGLTNVRTNNDGRYERVRRQDRAACLQIATKDPSTNALRSVSSSVRAAGEQIVLDIAMLGRGSVTGTVRSLNGAPVSGATVVALSQTDTQSQGSALSDSQGHYQIDNVVVGPVTVRAVKDGVGKSSAALDRAVGGPVDLKLDAAPLRDGHRPHRAGASPGVPACRSS